MANLPMDAHSRVCGYLYNRHSGEGVQLENGEPVARLLLERLPPAPGPIAPISEFTDFRQLPCKSAPPSALAVTWGNVYTFYLQGFLPSILRDEPKGAAPAALLGYASSTPGVFAPTAIRPSPVGGGVTMAAGPNALIAAGMTFVMALSALTQDSEPEPSIILDDPATEGLKIIASDPIVPEAAPAEEPPKPLVEEEVEETATASVSPNAGSVSGLLPLRAGDLSEGEGIKRIQDLLKSLHVSLPSEVIQKIWHYILTTATVTKISREEVLADPALFGSALADLVTNALNQFRPVSEWSSVSTAERNAQNILEVLSLIQAATFQNHAMVEHFWEFLRPNRINKLALSLDSLQKYYRPHPPLPLIWETLQEFEANQCGLGEDAFGDLDPAANH